MYLGQAVVCVCVFITVSHSIGLLVAADDWVAVLVRLAPVVKRPCLILTTTSPQPLLPPPPCYYFFAAGATTGPLHSTSGRFFLSCTSSLLSVPLAPPVTFQFIYFVVAKANYRPNLTFCVCFRNCSGLVSLFALSWATAMHRNILPYNKTIVNGCFWDLCYCLLLYVYYDFPLFSCFDISSLFFCLFIDLFSRYRQKSSECRGCENFLSIPFSPYTYPPALRNLFEIVAPRSG